MIAAIDLAPTILRYLGVGAIAPEMRGHPLETDGPLHSAGLRSLMARLTVVGGRRLKALACLLGAWALLLLASALWPGARASARRSRAMRVGALGVLWAPVAVLIGAATEPSATVEYATITLACLALGALTDALVPWPRAPLAPAIVTVVALVADALAHTQLLMRSLLGPNPILGARFYGFGNELKSGLAVLVLTALAAALYPGARGRRAALAMASAGVLLALVEGSARIGAGVGGVILVSAGFAVASAMLLPGAVTRRRVLVVLVSPLVALVALAALDLATAHGSGHYTGSILHARSAGELRDVIVRRYNAAWDELKNHAMPVATAVALIYAVLGVRRRRLLLAPVAVDPVWQAALTGGLTAGVVGALSEDSGPVLLVVAVFTLGCVLTYLWGRPDPPPRSLGTTRAARSRALTPSADPLAELVDRPLQAWIGEGHHQATAVAHEVVVVLLALAHALVADHRLAGLHALDEAQALQLVEDPVDARAAHPAALLPAQRVLDLNRRQRARLAVEQLQQRAPRAAALATGRGQRRLGALHPGAGPHVTIVEA